MIFFDTETCGLTGPIVLLQWATDIDNEIHLEELWKQPISNSIALFETLANHPEGIVGFNLSYDWFHVYKMWTILKLMIEEDPKSKSAILIDKLDQYCELEKQGRDYPYCLKPQKCFDIFLHARKGPYQSLMDRKDIRIRKIPNVLAYSLAQKLNETVQIKDIFFARFKDRKNKFQVVNNKEDNQFKDIVLKFAPSSALKALAIDALGKDAKSTLFYRDVSLPKGMYPKEYLFAPFGKALGYSWKQVGWPSKIHYHINHWHTNQLARQYAADDVKYTSELYYYFVNLYKKIDKPELEIELKLEIDDNDSVLACAVACCRWKGYWIDIEKISKLKEELDNKIKFLLINEQVNVNSPKQVKQYLLNAMSPEEKLGFLKRDSTSKNELIELSKWVEEDKGQGLGQESPTKVAERAKLILDVRLAKYDKGIYNKLLIAGRLHADLKVIGTLSGRMAGTGDLNVTGIKHTKEVRSCFPLANPNGNPNDLVNLAGGDFESFEVALAEASYNDPNLRRDLCTCEKCKYQFTLDELVLKECPKCGTFDSRTKVHALFAMKLFPGKSYQDIIESKKTNNDMYDAGKRSVFALIYGGNAATLKFRIGISEEIAQSACDAFFSDYRHVYYAREKIKARFYSMSQPAGIGTQVVWSEPADYTESMLGFRRYFTLENQICKALFDLANHPPNEWKKIKINVSRRSDRGIQTAGGATQSALYAAAFNIQSKAMKAAANHDIQAAGAQINKELQRNIWDLQPTGVAKWVVQPLNIHDEILCPCKPDQIPNLRKLANNIVKKYKPMIPLIGIDWHDTMQTWAEK